MKKFETKSYKSVDDMLAKMDAEERKHPVLTFLRKKIYYPILRIPTRIKDFLYSIKYFVQRGKRGYADCDIWGFDYYLARVIKEGVKRIKKVKHGVPMHVFKHNDGTDKHGNVTDEAMIKAGRRYNAILSDIAYTFHIIEKSTDHEIIIPSGRKYFTRTQIKAHKKYCKAINQKYPEHRIMTKVEFQRYSRGWDSFREYFMCLYD